MQPQPYTTPLKFFAPAWFAVVMGLSGLALAWGRARTLMGDMATVATLGLGLLALLVFAGLAVLSVLRLQRYPQALAEDLKHPVRHPFVATVPVSLILLATVLQQLEGPAWLATGLWLVGAVAQFAVTLWVVARWLQGNKEGGLAWAGVTPLLFIPVVGNVLVPLAGVPLGFAEWSAAQFGLGLLFWPVVLTLLLVRIATLGLWPERMLPATFITVAPPAVIGAAALQLGAPPAVAWGCWGVALFFLCWSTYVVQRMLAQPFAISFWALSFPLASFAALTLRLAPPTGAFAVLAMLTLAVSSVVITGLLIATYKGLRSGLLLTPETIANIVAAG